MTDIGHQIYEEGCVEWVQKDSAGDKMGEDSKPDSGMDEDSPLTSEMRSDDEDDEDEIIAVKKVMKKRLVILDEDDLDSGESQTSANGEPVNGVCEDEDTHNDVQSSVQDSDSDFDNETIGAGNTAKKSLYSNLDLFDAESDDDEKADVSDKESGNEGSDEGFEEDMLTPALKAKLKKGATKKPRVQKERKSKQKAYDTMDLHSESQRLIRESNVNVGYHEPSSKPVTDFMSRVAKKQQQYRSLRGVKNKEDRKVQVFQKLCPKDENQKTVADSCAKINIETTDSANIQTVHSDRDLVETPENSSQAKSLDNNVQTNEDATPQITNSDKSDKVNNSILPQNDDDDFLPDLEKPDEVRCLDRDHVDSKIHSANACSLSEQTLNVKTVSSTSENVVSSEKDSNAQISNYEDNSQHSERKQVYIEKDTEDNLTVTSQCENETPVMKRKKKLLELVDMQELPALTPTVQYSDKCVIDLDGGDITPQTTGFHKLMNRFIEHTSKTKKSKPKADVDISIVEKVEDKDELKMTKLTYHTEEHDEDPEAKKLDAPGAKLVALKENLIVKMKERRSEQRQKRVEIYELENEEGFHEEEEELTDHSDTDISDDEEFEEQFGKDDEEEDDDELEEKKPQKKNEFIDGEADEEDEVDADDEDDDGMGEIDDNKVSSDDDNDEDGMKLHLDYSDEDEENEDICNQRSLEKKKPKQLCISDDEDTCDVDLSQEKTDSETKPQSVEVDFLSPFSKQLSNPAGQEIEKIKKVSSFTYPVEDSQCLFENNADASPIQAMQSFTDDSQSQMLDDDGFLKASKSSSKKSSKPMLEKSKSEDMEELLGLCSGQFPETQADEKKSTNRSLFGSLQNGTQANMDELLDLCSGNFSSSNIATQKKGIKRKSPIDDEFDDETNDSFQILSDDDEYNVQTKKNALSDDEDDESDGDDNMKVNDSDNEVSVPKRPFANMSFKNKFGKIRQQFVEEEAELSGSEYDSDENLDLALEDDILEEEEGDNDVKMSDSALRDQVGRVHLKHMIDDDKRDIMLLQERYLTDGDLHSEGGGRMRSFKWRDIDNGSQEMFKNESDDDAEEEEEQNNEFKWRMERYEREKFLAEQKEKEEESIEDSQFVKFSRGFLKKKDSTFVVPNKDTIPAEKNNNVEDRDLKKMNNLIKGGRKGSFLNRGKEALSKIAERTKVNINPDAPTNSRKFVFTMLSPEKEKEVKDKPTVKRSQSLQPASKKPRLESRSNSIPKNSIFNHL